MRIEFDNVSKSYGDLKIFENLNLKFEKGKCTAILGPSGCGKTTILRLLSGMEKINSGNLFVEGTTGVVSQENSLFPWLTVYQNIVFGLNHHKAIKEPLGKEYIEKVGLRGYDSYYPHQISGGMKQRTNLARTLITKPDILLLDEPLGALDYQTKLKMQKEIKTQINGITTILITHDSREAVNLGDRVIVLSKKPAEIVADIYNPDSFQYIESLIPE